MDQNQPSYVVNVTRFGLPIVVSIFYLTASLGFKYTPDGTFQVLSVVKGVSTSPLDGVPSPLWQLLLVIGSWFRLDLLLTSKVLSLVFSCVVILAVYLVVNEIVRDRLIAFCVSLIFAMQGWLLQLAPSGSPLTLAITLSLGALFFLLRNEYVVAPFILGLCTMVLWQAAFLLVPLCTDIWTNSLNKRRATKVVLRSIIVYLSALLPSALYALYGEVKGVPVLPPFSDLPPFSFPGVAILVILVLFGGAGLVLTLMSSGSAAEAVRVHSSVLMFLTVLVLLGAVYQVNVWLGALSLIVMYAFLGLAEVLRRAGRPGMLHNLSFVMTGLLLVHLQLDYYRVNKPAMADAFEQEIELRIVADWLKVNVPDSQSVCAVHPGVLEYYAERPVALLKQDAESWGDLIVTSRKDVRGYQLAFQPVGTSGVEDTPVRHCAVWRKK